MGLFSFLTSKGSDESTTAASGAGREPAAAPAALPEEPAPDNAAGTGADEASAEPSAGWGMDTSALTAPSSAPPADAPSIGEPDPELTAELQGKIVDVIKTVYDPEIPVDIYELGLIYDIIVDTERKVLVNMTLTSPACPSAQQLPSEVRYKIKALPEVQEAIVEVVWEPPWDKDRMSEAAKLQLGFF